LAFHRGVQHHRYLLPTIRACEEIFHSVQDKRVGPVWAASSIE
jgi:hypothetical protein